MEEDKYLTRQTLLQRAQQQDEKAWEEFIVFYKDFICHILHKMNIQSIDFDDLVQDVLFKLWKGLGSYDKDKSKFRTWLSHVTRNTVLSYFRSKKRRPQGVDLESEESAVNKYFSELTDNQLEEMFEKEWQAYICSIAFENIKQLFSGRAIEAFSMTQKEIPSDEICQKLGIKKDSLYVLVSRVKSKYVNEIRRLIREMEF
ncbi:MAG: sigma-70 family RNA polymerase sigma factor [Lentisphaerales bacterium]|nr:sigma-70 family RNA polymerase sigma factor [Lentisphaerales bacterium]